MALEAQDLVFPNGRLDASMFGEALMETAQGLLDAASRDHPDASEKAVRAVVYARASRTLADRFNAEYASVDADDEGAVRRLQTQIKYWEKRATDDEAAAAGELPSAAEPSPYAGWPSVRSLR